MLSVAELLTPDFRILERQVRRKGRPCHTCGGTHYNARYDTCDTCRELKRNWQAEWRADHKRRGLCWYCTQQKGQGITCEHHRQYQRNLINAHNAAKREAGLCAYWSCMAASDTYWCSVHAAQNNAYRRRSTRRARARWS